MAIEAWNKLTSTKKTFESLESVPYDFTTLPVPMVINSNKRFIFENGRWEHKELTDISIDVFKQEKIEQINELRDKKYSEGFLYQGNLFQVDGESRIDFLGVYSLLKNGIENPHGGRWRTYNNDFVLMNDNEVETFLLSAFAFIKTIKQISWEHKDNIESLQVISEVINYNIESGW